MALPLLFFFATLTGVPDPALNAPVKVVRAEPFLRPADEAKQTTQKGLFRIVHQPLGEVQAERLRLPTPDATWKLTGRVGRLKDATIVAGFGTYLYWSRDEGKSWSGRLIGNLPGTTGPVNLRAFGVGRDAIYLAHELTAKPPLPVHDRTIHPLAISRSTNLGETWDVSVPLTAPPPYTFLAGDGNHIVELENGELIAALDAANDRIPVHQPGWLAEVFFRDRDGGRKWNDLTVLPDRAAEVGLLPLAGNRLLAARRGMHNHQLGGKTVQLAESRDGARTWSDSRNLTWVFGQAHGDIASLPGGGLVAVYENRYPVHEADLRARISWDGGASWEPELYILAAGVGYAGSVASPDGTVITVLGDGEHTPAKNKYSLQAIRWRPRPRR